MVCDRQRGIVFSCTFLIERLGVGGGFLFGALGSAPAFWNFNPEAYKQMLRC
jgi:hypothetical protein